VPAAGEAAGKFGLLAVAQVGQEPGPVVRLERGPGDLPAGRQPHSGARSGGPTFTAPQTAPAATDVVCAGSAAVLIVTPSPASARLIAVVRPMAPAPITRTSMSRPYPVAFCGETRRVLARADQGEGLELGVVGGRRPLGAGARVDRVRADRVVVGDLDTGLAVRAVARVDVEESDPVAGGRVALGRPDGVFHRVRRQPGKDARCGRGDGPVGRGEHLGLPL